MPKRCAVDGCKSQSASEQKRMKLLRMKEISLFSAPKSPSQLKKWNDALAGNRRKLSSTDVVCTKHFRDEDVETHYVTKLADGSTHLLERGRPCLRANAVPLSLSNDAECFEKIEKATTDSNPATTTLSTTMVNPKKILHDTIESVSVRNEEPHKETSEAIDSDENLPLGLNRYSIDCLTRDLKRTNWREGWVWSSKAHSSSIEFVQFDTANHQPRIYCCISNSMEITMFVGDKSTGIGIHGGTLESFAEMMALLGRMERLKPCAGTGFKAEIRAAACSGFIGDIYSKKSTSERCFSCRVVRRKLQRRRTMEPDEKNWLVMKKLHLLQRRHKTLHETAKKLKSKMALARRDRNIRKDKVLDEAIKDLPVGQQVAIRTSSTTSKGKCSNGKRNTQEWLYNRLLLRVKSKKVCHLRDRDIFLFRNSRCR